MAGTFDLLRESVGSPAGPDLVRGVEAMSADQIDSLAESILDYSTPTPKPSTPVTEIWPLIPFRSSLFFDHLNHESSSTSYAAAGISLSAATDLRLQGTGVFSSGIIRALLYCHGLFIEDPLSHAAEMHLASPTEVREVSRLALVAAATSMSEIAELLDASVIQTFYTAGAELDAAGRLGAAMMDELTAEGTHYGIDDIWTDFEVEFITGLSRPLQQLWAEIRGGNRNPSLDLVRQATESGDAGLADTFIDIVRILNPRNVVENAVTSTACTLASIELLGGSADVLCASPLMGRLIFLGAPDPAQQLRVHELARTQVPNIDALATSDLVAIRRTSEALAVWRTDLAAALDYADRARRENADPISIRQGITEIVAEARAALQSEAMKTRVLSHQNRVSFVAGALGGAGGSTVGGTLDGVIGGAAAGLFAALVQSLGSRRSVPGFLDRHYVAFSDERP